MPQLIGQTRPTSSSEARSLATPLSVPVENLRFPVENPAPALAGATRPIRVVLSDATTILSATPPSLSGGAVKAAQRILELA